MAYSEEHLRLRELLGEPIPEGGSDADTMFRDDRIETLLAEAANDVDRAAYEGWRAKAARLARLVDITEGNAQRKMSQAHGAALDMIRIYQRSSAGPTEGRARIGTIRRPPAEAQHG